MICPLTYSVRVVSLTVTRRHTLRILLTAFVGAGQLSELVLASEWEDSGDLVLKGFSVGRLRLSVCFLPNTLYSVSPSFSAPLTQRLISAGVTVTFAVSRISPIKETEEAKVIWRDQAYTTYRQSESDLQVLQVER